MAYDFNPSNLIRNPPSRKPGYCIFVDIVGSTAFKDRPITEWATFFHNTFINATCFLGRQIAPLKIIGDSCMFYLPEAKLLEMGEHALSLFTSLYELAAEPDDRVYREVRLSASFCLDAFELSFETNRPDFYGKDIDLTSRLLGFAGSREIVMNEEFIKRVRGIYLLLDEKSPYREVEKIFGPWPQTIKGFTEPVPIYKVAAHCLPTGHWPAGPLHRPVHGQVSVL